MLEKERLKNTIHEELVCSHGRFFSLVFRLRKRSQKIARKIAPGKHNLRGTCLFSRTFFSAHFFDCAIDRHTTTLADAIAC